MVNNQRMLGAVCKHAQAGEKVIPEIRVIDGTMPPTFRLFLICPTCDLEMWTEHWTDKEKN